MTPNRGGGTAPGLSLQDQKGPKWMEKSVRLGAPKWHKVRKKYRALVFRGPKCGENGAILGLEKQKEGECDEKGEVWGLGSKK